MMVLTNNNLKEMEVTHGTWKSQIQDALTVNGGNIEEATNFDYFMHCFTFIWKVIFSFIPPAGLYGGWLCFASSLAMIGILTGFIGDLASIFGCLVGLEDTITGQYSHTVKFSQIFTDITIRLSIVTKQIQI